MTSDPTPVVVNTWPPGDGSEARVVAELATRAARAETVVIGGRSVLVSVTPQGAIHTADLDQYGTRPQRKTGFVALHESASFSTYVSEHADDGTTLYGDWRALSIIAVLDDHGAEPGWAQHRATLRLRTTPEWDRWVGANGKLVDQQAFAEFIEDNLADIREPPAADLLEIAQSFQAANKVSFSSGLRIASGEVQLTYREEIAATAGRDGKLQVPSEFELQLAPFEGAAPYKVKARLRYRIREGRLAIGFALVRHEDVIRTAFTEEANGIAETTGRTVLMGAPR